MRKPASSFTFVLICFASISLATAGTNDAGRDTFVDDYYQRTVSLLASESYPEISEILDKMRETKLIGANGKRQLEAVYDELKTIEDTELLNQWCQGSNSSHYPFVVRGHFYLHQAQSYTHSFDTNISGLANNKRFNQYLNAAQDDIEKAHQLDPLDPSSSSAMITISMLRGYPKSVMEEWFNKAVTTDPLWISAYKNKLRYLSPNRYGSVKEMYNFTVSQTENSPPGSSVYSVLFEYFDILNTHHYPVEQDLFFSLNLPSKAHKLFHPTIEKFKTDFPDSSIPALYDGKYKFLQAEPDTAETLFTYILLKEPENIDALQSRALGYMQKKEWKKAEIDLEKLLRQTSNSAFALSNLGTISALLNEDIKSMKDFYAKAIELEKSSYMAKLYYLDLAVLLDRKKDYEEAIKAYDQALKIQPGFGRALLGRAESKHKSGKTEAAIEDLLIVINTGSRYKGTAEQRIEKYRKEQETHVQSQTSTQVTSPSKVISQPNGSVQTADITIPAPPKPGQFIEPGASDKLILNCEGFYYRKMTMEAIACYSSLLSSLPEHRQGQPYFMLGKIAETHEYNLPKAISYYGQAVERNPGNEKYIIKLGESLYKSRQFDKAIAVASKLIEINNTNGGAYYLRGLCFDEKGEREQAISDMQHARMYDPSITEADRYLAEYAVKQPVEIKISREDELLQLAEDNMRLQRYDEAEKQFKELIELDDINDYAHFRLGILYRSRDRNHKKAIAQFDKAIAINRDRSDYYLNRSSGLIFTGEWDAAISDLNNVIRLKPTNASAYSSRGSCYMKIGDYKNAEKDFLSALKYSPGNKSYMSKLAEANSKSGSGLSHMPEDAGMLIEKARVNISQKNYENAQNNLLKAVELDPNNSEPCYLLGKLFDEKLKDKDQAIKYYSRAIELNKGNRNYFFKRGLIYYHQQKFDSSIPDFDRALDLSPNDGQVLYYRGSCHRKLGHKDQAINDYLKVKQYAPSWTEAVNSHLEALM